MAITPNGFIAKKDDSSDFLTKKESQSYVATVLKAGALVIGRRTYGVLSKQSEFQKFLKAKIKIAIVSKHSMNIKSPYHKVANSPQSALNFLKGSKEIVVAGGGLLNASFMSENLVDEIYIDIEPNLFSEGIKLFEGGSFDVKLKLLGTRMLSKNEIKLHYKVLK